MLAFDKAIVIANDVQIGDGKVVATNGKRAPMPPVNIS